MVREQSPVQDSFPATNETGQQLDFPELRPLLDEWESRNSDPEVLHSLLERLRKLSLENRHEYAAVLFHLFPDPSLLPDSIPTEPFPVSQSAHGSSRDGAISLYLKLVRVSHIPFAAQNLKQAQFALRMITAILADIQLIAVFLVFKLHQLEQWDRKITDEKHDQAWIHLHVHAPLASRLGIFWIKSELEDRAFQMLNPQQYAELKHLVALKREERSKMVDENEKEIQSLLRQAGISHQVQGRYKRFYSIYQKLQRVDKDFEKIHDLYAFRILVPEIEQCYAALSYIHEQWTPLEDRFKDYIAMPKPNGYQSLHTTVLTTAGEAIEIQIRTYEMHHIAEYGIAAHWRYKEKGIQSRPSAKEENPVKREQHPSVLQIDLHTDKIYVMTPGKDIFELPRDSTSIDLAYSIHSQVGNRMVGAKANGSIIRMETPLRSGDSVEILTSPKQTPRKEWLDHVKTRHARNKIKHALHQQHREECRSKGSEMLDREFRKHGLNLNRMVKEGKLEHECKANKNQSFEHILFCIGDGSIRCEELLSWFVETPAETLDIEDETPAIPTGKLLEGSIKIPFIVEGMREVHTRRAKCCSPEPGDQIQGYLTQGHVISVHHKRCRSIRKMDPERYISVHWHPDLHS